MATDLYSSLSRKRSLALTALFDAEFTYEVDLPERTYLRLLKLQRVRFIYEDQRDRRDALDYIKITRQQVPALFWYCERCGTSFTGKRPLDGRCDDCKPRRRR